LGVWQIPDALLGDREIWLLAHRDAEGRKERGKRVPNFWKRLG
jgi:hypothetical protein